MTDAPPAGSIAILGGGKIGEALLSGLLARGRTPQDVTVSERDAARGQYIADKYKVAVLPVAEAARAAGTLVLAIKPQDIDSLLAELAPHTSARHLIVSVAAGIPTGRIEQSLPRGVAVVRCMPNTPALVDEAMTAVSPGANAGEEHLAVAEQLLGTVGRVVRVPEYQLDAVTALSGSGPAYFFYLVEAMIDAGILLGLPRSLAADLIVQTAIGASVMLRDSGEHPVQLREAVTSPGGTTIAAIRELEVHGVRAALIAAIEAAAKRSKELGGG
jgi:pyrroline-5-carboxylate reductase